MNRAQRRAMKKAKPQKVLDRKRAWAHIGLNILSADHEEIRDEDVNTIILPVYTALDRLSKGQADEEDYIRLIEANAFGFCLAKRIHDFGNAKDAMLRAHPIFISASRALEGVGERFKRTGRYGASGEELKHIRDTVQALNDMLPLTNRGHVLSAQRAAAAMVLSWMDEAEREERKRVSTTSG